VGEYEEPPVNRSVAVVLTPRASFALALCGLALSGLGLSGCKRSGYSYDVPVARQAIASERAAFKQDLIRNGIEAVMAGIPDSTNEQTWEEALWGVELLRYRSDGVEAGLNSGFAAFELRSRSFQRSLLETVYSMYPVEFTREVRAVFDSTRDEKLFAMASIYMVRAGELTPMAADTTLSARFPNAGTHPILIMLRSLLAGPSALPARPDLADLFAHRMPGNYPVVFSVQRPDRRYSGLALVRDGQGKFVRRPGGAVFSVPQLALSATNLPGFLTNGNTPQGVHSARGYDTSSSLFIGPTTNIQLVLPYEVNAQKFFHRPEGTDTTWSDSLYRMLLPPSWGSYMPTREAFFAGMAGRWDIIAHGTVIDPEYYAGEPCYPNTPSLGCLTAAERWSSESGERISSDQQALVDAMKGIGFERGFVVVVEIDSVQTAVTLNDVLPFVTDAEARVARP
jgi:hypothetical protein